MNNSKVYVGQIGVSIELDTKDDLSILDGATARRIKFLRPDGVPGFWEATQVGTVFRFITTAATDLPLAGLWKLQAYAEGPGWSVRGETVDMMIYGLFG